MPVTNKDLIAVMQTIRAYLTEAENNDFNVVIKLAWMDIGMALLRNPKTITRRRLESLLGLKPLDEQKIRK